MMFVIFFFHAAMADEVFFAEFKCGSEGYITKYHFSIQDAIDNAKISFRTFDPCTIEFSQSYTIKERSISFGSNPKQVIFKSGLQLDSGIDKLEIEDFDIKVELRTNLKLLLH